MICQSCAREMESSVLGTNRDGSINTDYCQFCYQKGEFISSPIMSDIIDSYVLDHAKVHGISEAEMRNKLQRELPKLKRWDISKYIDVTINDKVILTKNNKEL